MSHIPVIVDAETSEEDETNKSIVPKTSKTEKDVEFVEDVITEGLPVETSVSNMTPLRRSRRTSATSTGSTSPVRRTRRISQTAASKKGDDVTANEHVLQKTQETPRRGRSQKSTKDDISAAGMYFISILQNLVKYVHRVLNKLLPLKFLQNRFLGCQWSP